MQTLKRYYINVKFEKYGTYTFEARSKEHAKQMYEDGDYGWSDYSEDFGEFNEQIEDIEWCNLVREKVDSIMVSQINYEQECG